MAINLFLFCSELFKELYIPDEHAVHMQYLMFGLHGHNGLVPWIWSALAIELAALLLLLVPASRSLKWLNLACIFSVLGVWTEKGMGFIIPAFIPNPLGEIVEYLPTQNETLICAGVWAFGFFFYTLLLKVAVPILTGRLHTEDRTPVHNAKTAGEGFKSNFGEGWASGFKS